MASPPAPFPVQKIDPADPGADDGSVAPPDLPVDGEDASGESLLPDGPGLIEDPDGGENLLPGDDSGEDLLPAGDSEAETGPDGGDEEGGGGENLLPPDN